MKERSEEQVLKWLKKLQRESWQLELLVSGFTIFLLFAADKNLGEFITGLAYRFSGGFSILIIFLLLISWSIIALIVFLILHLLLRGFWIGAIGLRSVHPGIDFDQLNYSAFFQDKLRRKVIGLDRLIVRLDELCSVIFSVSFLIIFMLISFGLYVLFLGFVTAILKVVEDFFGSGLAVKIVLGVSFVALLLTGLIYLIDYFTLGFFKKFRTISRIYYPAYRFYSTITLGFISRSIYYNLISKYSKRRIRLFLSSFLIFIFFTSAITYDQHTFFPEGDDDLVLDNNYYDDMREQSAYVSNVSVESRFITGAFVPLFIRYNVGDNERIQSNCPDFEPMKNDGINSTIKVGLNDGLQIQSELFQDEDKEMLLSCLSKFYEVSINDSVCHDLKYYFYEHPSKHQKGIMTVFMSEHFRHGENSIIVKKKYIDSSDSVAVSEDLARIPIWFTKE
jgi:hypothetical protein